MSQRIIHPSAAKPSIPVHEQYHLSPESKFENGRFLDRGRTERRHIVATEFVLIGKEANMVGESGEADPIVVIRKILDHVHQQQAPPSKPPGRAGGPI